MPKDQREDDKKHGDKLESLIERTGGSPKSDKEQRQKTERSSDGQDGDER